MTVRTETSLEVVLPAVGGRSEAEVRRLYENAPIGFAATVINASILVGILRDWVDPSVLALWRDRGLGMAIVLAIVNRHGGRIVVDSVPLRGTEVRLLLPKARSAGAPPGPKE
jgi:light-regulated signal transduction histidine kinase (bacteriophytochrome)